MATNPKLKPNSHWRYSDWHKYLLRGRNLKKGREHNWLLSKLDESSNIQFELAHSPGSVWAKLYNHNKLVVYNRPALLDLIPRTTVAHTFPFFLHKANPFRFKLRLVGESTRHDMDNELVIDLLNMRVTNPAPAFEDRVDPEKRREWLRCIKRLKQIVAITDRLGGFPPVERKGAYPGGVLWDRGVQHQLLLQAVKTGELSPELLDLIYEGLRRLWTPMTVPEYVDYILTEYSHPLRVSFGYFRDCL